MITCPSCHAQNEDGAAFCDNCGAALTQPTVVPQPAAPAPAYLPPIPQPAAGGYPPIVTPAVGANCPQCGAALVPGAAFCDNCGAPMGAAPPPQPYPQPYPQPVQPQPYPQPVQPQPAQPPVYGGQPRLIVQPTNTPIILPPNKTQYIVGREDPVSNIFPEVDMTPYGGDEGGVSRRHARLFQQGGQWYIEDYNTTNFTYVNNQKVQPGVPVPVQNGAELRFGRVKVTFYVQ